MGDVEGAREILLEVLKEGSANHQQAARELLAQL
jgi:FimV-like protein